MLSASSSGHESDLKGNFTCSSTSTIQIQSRSRTETEAVRFNESVTLYETVTDMSYCQDKILTDEIKRQIILSTSC